MCYKEELHVYNTCIKKKKKIKGMLAKPIKNQNSLYSVPIVNKLLSNKNRLLNEDS